MTNIIYDIYKTLYKTYGPQHWWPAKTKLEIIIGAILTQNTSWHNVEKAITNLKKYKLISVDKLHKIKIEVLQKVIRPAGFYKQKSQTLKNLISFLMKEYNGKITTFLKEKQNILREKLLAIKGIGKETADSIILYAANKPLFVVDKYTRRIFSRHSIIKNENIEYDKLQNLITKNLPKKVKIYNEFHALLVKVGKSLCKRVPHCEQCPLKKYLLESQDNEG
jgi:endonuclease-3 related protein